MLKYKVLASQLTSLTDARFFAAHGVDWIGFLLTPGHKSSVDLAQLAEIKNWIEGPSVIGQFIQPNKQEIKDAISIYNLDGILIDAQTPLETIQDGFSVPIFREILVKSEDNLAQAIEWSAPFVDYFILKIPDGLSDTDKKTQIIREICDTYEVILENEQNNNLPPQIVERLLPSGLVANASQATEETVGIKSFESFESLFDFLQDETD